MSTKPVDVGSLKAGNYVVIDGVACVVKNVERSRPGKHGHAKCRIEAVGLVGGQKKIIISPAHDTIESPIVEKETAQILSIQGDVATAMDMKTFETIELKIPEELNPQVKPGVQILYWVVMGLRSMKQVKAQEES